MLRHLAPLFLLTSVALAQTPLTFGNLFVVRVGDGVAALTNASTATFVDEYTPAGTLVQSIAMPTVAVGANQPLTNSGTATSEGFLNLSENGLYLTLAGYGIAPGTPSVPGTASLTTPRVIGRIDLTGGVDTSTALDAYSAGNIRSVVSTDGTLFWTTGSNGGVRFATLGATTTTGINAGAPTNVRVAGIYNGQLYASSSSGSFTGVCTVGTGIPQVGPATVTMLPGLPTPGPSSYDFWFADPQTLYIADDRAIASNGGILKYSLIAGSWTLQYTLQPPGTIGCRGLSGRRINGVTTLYATNGSQLLSIDDTGASSTFTVVTGAPLNTAFRGVRFLSKPTTLLRLTGGCGQAGISATGTGEIGTDVVTTITNPVGLPFVGYGITPFGLQACTCTVLHDFTLLVNGPQHTLSLPNAPAIVGFVLLIQGVDFLAPTTCTQAPFDVLTLTDGYSMVVQ